MVFLKLLKEVYRYILWIQPSALLKYLKQHKHNFLKSLKVLLYYGSWSQIIRTDDRRVISEKICLTKRTDNYILLDHKEMKVSHNYIFHK
jgi:hypothetical protein